ncbi:glycoside hydrolase family 3 C-terminal domain-containing protein [Nocardioides aquiterrae]|uniref:Glycoside hydrolase family 3 C-terminal domain-containing protein n=1 Tax=Nocardioides aquiterrae TaxID=203799 RepID=A0ABP4EWK2_9ACTN
MRRVLVAAVGLALLPFTVAARPAQAADPCAAWMDPHDSADHRADALVAAMTQDQKLGMLTFSDPPWFAFYGTAGHVDGIPELCVPDLVLSDAGSGVAGLQVATTVFPSGVAQASTWDPALQRRLGRAIGEEAYAKGINVLLGPGMNIARTPYNGRNFEYFGEDPHLAASTATAFIRGIQDNPVLASAKHYAFNNQETDRMTVDVRVDERTRREIYLPAFEAAVTKAHVGSVMCSYNRVGGTYACENPRLLTGYLRDDWGFDGFVESDWGATHSTGPAAMAGLDLEMHASPLPQRYFSADNLRAALADGSLTRARVDDMVRNVVRPMFAHGLFDHPVQPGPEPYLSDVSTPHTRLARTVAAEGTVLLKNRDGLLPFRREGGRTIAVIGWAANPVGATSSTSGGGSSHGSGVARQVSPLEGITTAARAHGDRVVYVEGSNAADAQAAAAAADEVVVVATDGSSEGSDRPDLGFRPAMCVSVGCSSIPLDQEGMIAAAAAANPHTVVVLDVGGPVRMPWLADAGAVLVPWYGGLQHGNALADVLYGAAEPGGRLPQTFPRSEAQASFAPKAYPGVDGRETYEEGLLVGYRGYDARGERPLFPFGFGLGYTTFAFRDLDVRRDGAGAEVTFTVRNTGDRAGAAVPQVYVSFPRSAGEPPKRLEGFDKLTLAPGKSRRVTIHLDRRAFAYWDRGWTVDPGRYRISVGSSSRDLPLRTPLTLG